MLKLLSRLAVFLLPVTLGLGALEWRLRETPDDYTFSRTLIETLGRRSAVLVVGSSYERRGIDPSGLPCAGINVAAGNQSIPVSAAIVGRFARQMPALEVVVIGVSPYTLDFPNDPSRFALFQHGFGMDAPPLKGQRWWHRLLLIEWTPREGIRWVLDGGLQGISERGWNPCDRSWANFTEASMVHFQRRKRVMNASARKGNEDALRSAVASAREAGAIPVLLVSPASPAYRGAMPAELQQAFGERIREFVRQEEVILADYLADSRFGNEDFCDPDHLSRAAAAKFSAVFSSEVLEGLLHCSRFSEGAAKR